MVVTLLSNNSSLNKLKNSVGDDEAKKLNVCKGREDWKEVNFEKNTFMICIKSYSEVKIIHTEFEFVCLNDYSRMSNKNYEQST